MIDIITPISVATPFVFAADIQPEAPAQAHPDPDETEWSTLVLDASETSWTLI